MEHTAFGTAIYRMSYTYSYYDIDTVHLLTRHPINGPFPGYFAPLTTTSWAAFISATILIIAITFFIGASFGKLTFNILPICGMYHFEEQHRPMADLRGGQDIF